MVQGQVFVTRTQVDINLLELTQELDYGKKCFVRSGTKTRTMKKYFWK
jgi:hypothetical protein